MADALVFGAARRAAPPPPRRPAEARGLRPRPLAIVAGVRRFALPAAPPPRIADPAGAPSPDTAAPDPSNRRSP